MDSRDKISGNLRQEARDFDNQIEERISNGHIPDLRLSAPCDYFYNNSWRRPYYVQLDFVERFEVIRDSIIKYSGAKPEALRVLEIGCGPGYLSLELARSGFNVVGLDISEKCIEVARETARKDPWINSRAKLEYISGDLLSNSALVKDTFDVVVFMGALHHFPDQSETLRLVKKLLNQNGIIVASEPARDKVTYGNAAFAHLLTSLLSINNNYYKHKELPSESAKIFDDIEKKYRMLKYEDEDGAKKQSINDNEAGYNEMYLQLTTLFQKEHFEWRYSFFHEVIGGLRFDEQTNSKVAFFLREMDRILVKTGVLQSTEFLFVGRKCVVG